MAATRPVTPRFTAESTARIDAVSTDVSCPAPHRTAPSTRHSTYAVAGLRCPVPVACSV